MFKRNFPRFCTSYIVGQRKPHFLLQFQRYTRGKRYIREKRYTRGGRRVREEDIEKLIHVRTNIKDYKNSKRTLQEYFREKHIIKNPMYIDDIYLMVNSYALGAVITMDLFLFTEEFSYFTMFGIALNGVLIGSYTSIVRYCTSKKIWKERLEEIQEVKKTLNQTISDISIL